MSQWKIKNGLKTEMCQRREDICVGIFATCWGYTDLGVKRVIWGGDSNYRRGDVPRIDFRGLAKPKADFRHEGVFASIFRTVWYLNTLRGVFIDFLRLNRSREDVLTEIVLTICRKLICSLN